jgi:phosphoribosylanthranilate isomerase
VSESIIKVCGLTHPDDVRCAVKAGATHVGFVFAPGRRRTVDPALWLDLMDASGDARRVGVFQGNEIAEVLLLADMWGLAVIQLHGGYSTHDVDACNQGSTVPVWWAQKPEPYEGRFRVPPPPAGVSLIVLDSAHAGEFGGTGLTLPWSQIERPEHPFLIAGGLSAHNVGDAIHSLNPFGVDASSGVEDSTKAPRKSHDAIRAFVSAATHALVSRETTQDIVPSSDNLPSGQPGDTLW